MRDDDRVKIQTAATDGPPAPVPEAALPFTAVYEGGGDYEDAAAEDSLQGKAPRPTVGVNVVGPTHPRPATAPYEVTQAYDQAAADSITQNRANRSNIGH